ncbi:MULTISPECIES: site-specific DNA-methyltransferase [unclassified Chelatococcus]|uniref:site-specific DNA-methyltransferase n=1 Tax=unclassified Chelatococcus TaxID=2638111 RepID=UPI001BCCF717|nr:MULTISPECIES: site-specific DNA-methyltransferase [unclassified Chelatococcus]MBS7698982.1 site-specific DNA-methyltransferase [Chelatococcus sp. YT9]MBX3558915.1 site-specific DNA-methyltransferase [Chelatococcus sp.]
MDKLKMHSSDLSQDNIAKIREMFPGCVTEARDEATGAVRLAVDFDQLRQELSDHIVEGPQERYRLDWPGKREALVAANAPIARTVRPSVAESLGFKSTKNLFIEGDNLEALKLLQQSFLGAVKMIYIDPPYNTGNDFVYVDDFSETTKDFFERSMQVDNNGNRLFANTESNGRFHSDWLSLIYPRLKLARNLLSDDGLIFISIGDAELANLNKLCDEVFGGENFIANFVWEKRTNRENRKVVSSRHDYIVCYTKSRIQGIRPIAQLPMSEKALANYKNPDNDPRGDWKSDPATAQAGHGTKSQFYVLEAPNGKKHELESGRCWVYTKPEMDKAIADGRIWFGRDGNGVPRIKTYLDAKERGLTPETMIFAEDATTNEVAKNALKELFDGKAVFETPKPVSLLKLLIQMSCQEGVVLDFFAGSASLAHSVMELSAQDGGLRQCISVQIPEETPAGSEARKAGYETITEIAKERIRRAGKKILEGECHPDWNRDVGFRVLKVDTSNMKDVYYRPDELKQSDLLDMVDNVKEGRTAEDLLFQVLVDWGVDLTLPIRRETVQGKTVFFVDDNALVACFDRGVTEDLVKELAKREPLRVVFRDNGFVSDAVKINVEQIFRQLSPTTDVKSI